MTFRDYARLREQMRAMLGPSEDEAIGSILAVMDGLCSTCPENRAYNPDAKCDCNKRAGRVSAPDVYYGTCDDEVLGHWLSMMQDYRGALRLFAGRFGDSEPLDPVNHQRFVDGCRRAQALLMEGKGWREATSCKYDYGLLVGMAYMLQDKNNSIYAEMRRLGLGD